MINLINNPTSNVRTTQSWRRRIRINRKTRNSRRKRSLRRHRRRRRRRSTRIITTTRTAAPFGGSEINEQIDKSSDDKPVIVLAINPQIPSQELFQTLPILHAMHLHHLLHRPSKIGARIVRIHRQHHALPVR
ncbi:hypothetical protein PanWU01x14_081940 [Parasponia andersonii]|uniref:Uncharacterized protein n=1 Tax=Parasponia andersonii TaxID=3476 RepID=A0A2P5DAG6_PARAD|nr:hypothetical protein PanWU01x14_081940 [Parasponia andersonii]